MSVENQRIFAALRDIEEQRSAGPTIIAALRDAANHGGFDEDALCRDVERLRDQLIGEQ